MLQVHHLNNSRSQRILWLLEELNLDYQLVRYERDSQSNLAPESLKEIHPLGKSPVITDGENVIAESGCIIEYLVEKYGQGRFKPDENSAEFWAYKYWIHYAEGTLMPLLVLKLIFNRIETAKQPFFVKPIAKAIANKVMSSYVTPNLENNLNVIDKHLEKNKWIVGDKITAADFQMIFPLEAAISKIDASQLYPNIRKYVHKIHSLPTYQAGLAKGGEYAYAKVA